MSKWGWALIAGTAVIGGLVAAGAQPELRVTNPTARDPARALVLLLTCSFLLFALAIVVGNVVLVCWLGLVGVVLVPLLGSFDLLLLSALAAALEKLNRIADPLRRRHKYLISADDYAAAPLLIPGTMKQIFKSAWSLRASRAHREGMFGAIDIQQVLYSAAEQAVQAAEINASVHDLEANAGPTDADALRRARVALLKIDRYLDKVEAELKGAAKTAKSLSKKLNEAERARAVARKEELAAERRREAQAMARANIENSTARAKSTTRIDATDIADRVGSVSAGYDEARRVSDDVLHGPGHRPTESPLSFTKAAWKAARGAVRWVNRISRK
jgi:hypothetical protein